jgi:anti-sigma factor (TIGR02949 family)
MDCRQCNDELTAYIDGELSASDAKEMNRHLEKCPPCLREYRDLKSSTTLVVTHAQELAPSPEIWNNLRSRIAEMPAPANSFGLFQFLVINRWAAALSTMAAIAVLFVGMWGYMQHQQSLRNLEASMQEYIQTRSVAEQIHGQQLRAAESTPVSWELVGPANMENPFAEMRPVSFTNPFKSEDR